ncbi:MAG: peptidylprolyl isomerase [Elusimicrobia bacterium]|nr:peptidylprolyl isomerase [Elusimicrobiota bacterium]
MRRLTVPVLGLLCACSSARPKTDAAADAPAAHRGLYAVLVTPRGSVEARLFEDDAPKTVADFAARARRGDFDGTPLARAVPGFIVQGGVRSADAALELEASAGRGFRKEGRLAAPSQPGGSVPGQFFFTLAPLPWLDGRNAVFGEVTSGFEVLAAAAAGPRAELDASGGFLDRPQAPLMLDAVRIEERR